MVVQNNTERVDNRVFTRVCPDIMAILVFSTIFSSVVIMCVSCIVLCFLAVYYRGLLWLMQVKKYGCRVVCIVVFE